MTGHPDSWLRHELRRKLAEIADLRTRLAATERHATDLRTVNDQLRAERDTACGDLAIARAQLAEAEAQRSEYGPVLDMLKPVWRP